MQNTGTWNSDEAIFYFLVVISPICLYFLGAFVNIALNAIPDTPESEISFTQAVGEKEAWQAVKDRCLEDAVNGDYRARDWLTKNCYGTTTPVPQPKQNPKTKPKTKNKKKDTTNPEVIDEAIVGLVGLGYKKAEARRIINKLAVSKLYKNSEVLLRDVISSV
jgi:hypothetical protein